MITETSLTGRIIHRHLSTSEYEAEEAERRFRHDWMKELNKETYVDRWKGKLIFSISSFFFLSGYALSELTEWSILLMAYGIVLAFLGMFYLIRIFCIRISHEKKIDDMLLINKVVNS